MSEQEMALELWEALKRCEAPIFSAWYRDGYADAEGVTFARALEVVEEMADEGYEGYVWLDRSVLGYPV